MEGYELTMNNKKLDCEQFENSEDLDIPSKEVTE